MRILITNLLAVAALLFSATSASAWAFNSSVRGGLQPSYAVGDTLVVDIFMDADVGLTILGLGVNAPAAALSYDPAASTALPVIYPAPSPAYYTTGNHPGYVLYTAGKPATIVYPLKDPKSDPFTTWPSPGTGLEQVNVNYAEGSLGSAAGSGTNIWIASLVYHVIGGENTVADIALSLTSGGNVLTVNQVDLDPSVATLSGPIGVNIVPEPTTAALIGLGVLGLALAGRRR